MQSWNGTLTPEIRKKLQEKRAQLGASCQSVGSVLNVTESIVLKWESGKVRRVSVTMRPRLDAFLKGEFDDRFQQWRKPRAAGPAPAVGDGSTGGSRTVPAELRAVFDHVASVYKVCRSKPAAQAEMLKAVESAADEVVDRLLAGKSGK
jgi:DNA-binding XRE family transcriptional regulator